MDARTYSGRTEQNKASQHRQVDAQKLREAKRWRGAMYLLGYAIECALKAKLMERHDLWDLHALGEFLSARLHGPVDVFTHSLHTLMNWSEAELRMDRGTVQSWGIIRRWQVDWRYSPDQGNEVACGEFFEAAKAMLQFVRNSI
jgi:hypothetical protein